MIQPKAESLNPGTRIDRFELETLLGFGGFGAVYRARHTVLDRYVALKLLHPEHTSNDELLERFFREAQASAAIGSRHIARVYDCGQSSEGWYFLSMELLEGRSLETRLDENPRPFEINHGVSVALQVLESLAAAHSAGIIHRDLKPANIFLAFDEKVGEEIVKLLDFGVSKFRVEQGSAALTQSGAMLGTPLYMAPEQFHNARDVDLRVDIYSAAAVLYEMLSLRVPYEARSYAELVVQICCDDPKPLATVASNISIELNNVVMKGLVQDPDKRWSSAEAFATALWNACPHSKPPTEIDVSGEHRALPIPDIGPSDHATKRGLGGMVGPDKRDGIPAIPTDRGYQVFPPPDSEIPDPYDDDDEDQRPTTVQVKRVTTVQGERSWSEIPDDSPESVPPGPNHTPSRPAVSPSEPVISPSGPTAIASAPVGSPSEPAVLPSEPPISPSGPPISPSEPVVTPVGPNTPPPALGSVPPHDVSPQAEKKPRRSWILLAVILGVLFFFAVVALGSFVLYRVWESRQRPADPPVSVLPNLNPEQPEVQNPQLPPVNPQLPPVNPQLPPVNPQNPTTNPQQSPVNPGLSPSNPSLPNVDTNNPLGQLLTTMAGAVGESLTDNAQASPLTGDDSTGVELFHPIILGDLNQQAIEQVLLSSQSEMANCRMAGQAARVRLYGNISANRLISLAPAPTNTGPTSSAQCCVERFQAALPQNWTPGNNGMFFVDIALSPR